MPWGWKRRLVWMKRPLGEIFVQDIQVCGEEQSELSWLSALAMPKKQRSPKPRVPIAPACSLAQRPCVLLPFQALFFGCCWSLDPSPDVSRPYGFKVGEARAP